jgi:HD superfamily phosphohydrolase
MAQNCLHVDGMASVLNSRDRHEIRCPVHGFIRLNDWEMGIISEPAFQRLRRIRQLAWTDLVYPGAMHNRFEHSLGVMHTATLHLRCYRPKFPRSAGVGTSLR